MGVKTLTVSISVSGLSRFMGKQLTTIVVFGFPYTPIVEREMHSL
jgi:hypothetical protein